VGFISIRKNGGFSGGLKTFPYKKKLLFFGGDEPRRYSNLGNNKCGGIYLARKNGGFSGGLKILPYKKIVIFWWG